MSTKSQIARQPRAQLLRCIDALEKIDRVAGWLELYGQDDDVDPMTVAGDIRRLVAQALDRPGVIYVAASGPTEPIPLSGRLSDALESPETELIDV